MFSLHFERLVSFYNHDGHFRVPKKYADGQKPILRCWLGKQTSRTLSKKQKEKLLSVGFNVDKEGRPAGRLPNDDHWNANFDRLVAYLVHRVNL